jgi:hypothetical protein
MHEGSRQSACLCFVALDLDTRQMYWTQKASSNARQGRTIRAGIDIPDGDTTPERRRDVAVIIKDLPEPIDLELDLAKRTIYWTVRGDSPIGNTVNRAPMDVAAGDAPRVLLGGLQVIETIRKMSSTHEYCDFAV